MAKLFIAFLIGFGAGYILMYEMYYVPLFKKHYAPKGKQDK